MKGDFVLKNNTNRPVKSAASQERSGKCAEPYVGMPIYLDDSFFDFIDEDRGGNCPIDDDMGDEMDNCMMPGGCPMPENGGMMPRNGCPMPGNGRMMPGSGCPMPDNGCMMPGGCPMPGNGGMMPEYGLMPETEMPAPAPTPTPAPAPMPTPMPAPTPAPTPMPTPMPAPMPMDCASTCPLAMAYVPWQIWDMTYEMEEGFAVGTIFPELDLPFLGGTAK